MAVAFPSYLDALVEGFPPASKATSFPQHEYIEDSQNVREFLKKLFGRLSVLLFHIDKQINKVLIQGRLLPKKLNQWAMEARAMKCQVSNLLEEQQNRKGDSLKCEEWIEIGLKMINLLKKCPFKDEMMYDKPTPVIIQNSESSSEIPSGRLKEKHKVEETSHSYLEGNEMEHKQPVTEQSFSTLKDLDVRQDQAAGVSSDPSFPAVKLQKDPVENFESGPISSTEIIEDESSDMLDAVISKICSAESNSSSIPEDKCEQQFATEITEESNSPKGSKTKMFRNMPMSVSSSDTEQIFEPEFHGVDEMPIVTYSGEQKRTEPTPLKTERSNDHGESIPDPIFQEKEHYSVVAEDNNLLVKLDNQSLIILIGDYSSPQLRDRTPGKTMLNLAAQDLRELPEKSNFPHSLLLLLQRNNRLTFIHPSIFDSMPDLQFLDISDTKIRILPGSLLSF